MWARSSMDAPFAKALAAAGRAPRTAARESITATSGACSSGIGGTKRGPNRNLAPRGPRRTSTNIYIIFSVAKYFLTLRNEQLHTEA